MSQLPDKLGNLDLPMSAAALLFALGHDYEMPTGLNLQEKEKLEFLKKLRNQPAAEQLPQWPLLYDQRKVELKSRTLGCNIAVNADNVSPCVELAESVLAALEALLATGVEHRIFAHEPELTIAIRRSDFAMQPFQFNLTDRGGRPYVEVASASFHPHKMTPEVQRGLKDKLFELQASILARVFTVEVSEQQLRTGQKGTL